MIDLSNNENTLLRHDFSDLQKDLICRYPCDNEYLLKDALARLHGVKATNITLGCGSSDIIYRTFLALNTLASNQNKKLNLIVPAPTFDLVLSVARAMNIKITFIPCLYESLLGKIKPKSGCINLIYITNPNNPSAYELSRAELDYLAALCVDDTYMILDEAYAEYNPDFKSLPKTTNENILFTRTFSKIYALAGLRLGYAISHESLLSYIDNFILLDNINHFALYAALELLQNPDFLARSQALTKQSRKELETGLKELEIQYFASNVNFILHEIKSEKYRDFMLANGIKVGRAIANHPLLNRISVGSLSETQYFLNTLKKAKAQGLV